LEKENYNLKNGLKQMTKNINETNEIYFKKKTEYDNNIKSRDIKLREYKNKISILKMKINELHQEIRVLKNNQTSFLSQKNNEINKNQFQNGNMKLISHTPKLKKKEIPFELNFS
jgi:CII-binding regulator of phage lambda lysogenization HflD